MKNDLEKKYIPTERRPSGLMVFRDNLVSTPVAGSVWTKILGPTVLALGASDVTMPTNNRLQYFLSYNYDYPPIFVIGTACVSVLWSGAPTQFAISFYKNGSNVGAPICYSHIDNDSGRGINISVEIMVEMSPNDYLELWCESSSANATGLRVTDGSISLNAV